MTKIIAMNVLPNAGYSADQVSDEGISLRDLMAAIETAIHEFGEDAILVTQDSGNRYGARFGYLEKFGDLFEDTDDDTERCPACGNTADHCQGHGEIGDPEGARTLSLHDEGEHGGCHPEARCED